MAAPSFVPALELERSVEARIDHLSRALRLWATRRYGLVSPGPPPVYREAWQSDDIAIVRAWARFGEMWREFRHDANERQYDEQSALSLGAMDIAVGDFEAKFRSMGVNPDDRAILQVRGAAPIAKPLDLPKWAPLAIVGGLGVGAWALFPSLKRYLGIGAAEAPETPEAKPVTIDDVRRLVVEGRSPRARGPDRGFVASLPDPAPKRLRAARPIDLGDDGDDL